MSERPRLLVPENSPLRNPPGNLDAGQKVALDGVRFAIDMAHLSLVRLTDDLSAASTSFEAGRVDREATTYAFADAWAVVDNLWRLNLVVERMRGFKRPPELTAQLRALVEVKDFRDYIHHFDEEYDECAASGRPLWGSLSWFWTPRAKSDEGLAFLMVSGAFRSAPWQVISNPAGRTYHTPVGLVTLSAFGREIELSRFVGRLAEIGQGFEEGLKRAIATLSPEAASTAAPGGTDFMVALKIKQLQTATPAGN